MGIVGISSTTATTAGSLAHSSPVIPSWWLVCPRFCCPLRAVGIRRLVIASERQEFYPTQTSDDKQYVTSSYSVSRSLQITGTSFPPVSLESKRHMIHGPGYLVNYHGPASKTALLNNAYSWLQAGEHYHKKRMTYKILQQIGDKSRPLRADNTCAGVTLEDFPSAVTEFDTISLDGGSYTLENLLQSSLMPQDVELANNNFMGTHELTSLQFDDHSKETKTLTGMLQKDSPSTKPKENSSKINGATHDANVEISDASTVERSIEQKSSKKIFSEGRQKHQKNLTHIYGKVVVVETITVAREIVQKLTTTYKDHVHACDTEVAKIDIQQETPVGHGEIICFSIYSGPNADFGDGKSCIWVDVLDGDRNILLEFAPFFEDRSIRKVWHNYSFDFHVIRNYGINISGFHADTMHLARLWDSSRRMDGGYSLEGLTGDMKVMSREQSSSNTDLKLKKGDEDLLIGKISLKDVFGKKKLKKDGSVGKITTVAPVEELQRGERISWVCYSARDSIKTLDLYESLKEKLIKMPWNFNGMQKGTMFDFYEEYWRPFGIVLVEMEEAGMLVDLKYLSDIEKVAIAEQQAAVIKFRKWASKYCPDAKYMNVGSDTQVRQLLFGGIANIKDQNEFMPVSRTFKAPNIDNMIEDGKKSPSKYRNITIHKIGEALRAEIYTPSGWPSVGADALKTFAGKVSADHIYLFDDNFPSDGDTLELFPSLKEKETDEYDGYGTAYDAFGKGREGADACHAISSLCEICSIDSLISNFILPLQGDSISGREGRIHCSLNINTETGRLSARRPNLQNPPALEKDRYKIRQAFVAAPGNSLIVADYGQLELRILAHLASCKSMLDAFKAGGDFHSRTAMNMYPYIREAVESMEVLLEWQPQAGEEKPPVPLLKDAFATERRRAKMLNFSIAYGKTPVGLSKDWKVPLREARETVRLWYNGRQEVLKWQEERKKEAVEKQCVYTLLGRARKFPSVANVSNSQRGHIERAAINTPVQGSAADVAMCAMIEIVRNHRLKELKWKLLLQVHDEVILEGPSESAEEAKAIVVECMSKPFYGQNILNVDLAVDAKCAQNWYAAK